MFATTIVRPARSCFFAMPMMLVRSVVTCMRHISLRSVQLVIVSLAYGRILRKAGASSMASS